MNARIATVVTALLAACLLVVAGAAGQEPPPDTTPPVVTSNVGGQGGSNGWFTGDVSVTWTASDPEDSDLATSGCEAATISTDTSGTTLTCTATNDANLSTSESVTVKLDKTPPAAGAALDRQPDANGWYRTPVTITFSGNDATSGIASCSGPVSYSGPDSSAASVSGTCTDAAGLTGSVTTTFQYDSTGPTVTVSGPSGTISSRSATVSASAEPGLNLACALDGQPAACGATFENLGDGGHTFSAQATDAAGNVGSASTSWTVDATPPTVTIASGPSGNVVTTTAEFRFSSEAGATFACSLDGAAASPCTSPQTYSGLADGAHTFSVSATDVAGNSAAPAVRSWAVDAAPPAVTVPGDRTVEAASASGAVAFFAVTATDDGQPLPPSAISCSHLSGATFRLGTTRVTCTATNANGNAGTGAFAITVADSTPPVLTAPPDLVVATGSADGVTAAHPSIADFLRSAVASDMVDPAPRIAHAAPAIFRIGENVVTFTATDSAGNVATAQSLVRVVLQAPGAPAPVRPAAVDRTPPGNVTALSGKAGDRQATLTWKLPPDSDIARIVVRRSTAAGEPVEITLPVQAGYRDTRLVNGVEYRYVIVTYDRAGNRSAGVAVVLVPKASLLLAPKNGARVAGRVVLTWARMPAATYYNVQLYRGAQKIFTVWPTGRRLTLPVTWRYRGRRHRLTPGLYRWYVFPGFGARSQVRYGAVLGESTFTYSAKKPKPKPRG